MWHHLEGQKKHTQDPCELAKLMRDIGKGLRPIHAVDVGCGDGILAFEMLRLKRASHVVALDISKEAIRAARENLRSYTEIGKADVYLKKAQAFFRDRKNWDRFQLFAINPPFFTAGSGRPNMSSLDQVARHEASLRLKDWAKGASRILCTGGELYCVFPTERLAELCAELVSQRLEPKEIWWQKHDRRRRRFFLRAVRGARSGVKIHL